MLMSDDIVLLLYQVVSKLLMMLNVCNAGAWSPF